MPGTDDGAVQRTLASKVLLAIMHAAGGLIALGIIFRRFTPASEMNSPFLYAAIAFVAAGMGVLAWSSENARVPIARRPLTWAGVGVMGLASSALLVIGSWPASLGVALITVWYFWDERRQKAKT